MNSGNVKYFAFVYKVYVSYPKHDTCREKSIKSSALCEKRGGSGGVNKRLIEKIIFLSKTCQTKWPRPYKLSFIVIIVN